MNIKKLIISAVLVSLNCLTCSAFAESSVWKVSKGKNYFYIGGTIHLLKADDHPLPKEFDQAYKDSSKIVFETDLSAAQSPEFQMKFMTAIQYTDERVLASDLTPETYQKLEKFLASRQIPIANFVKFQPWGVSLMIAMLEYQRFGMLPNYGVDSYFNGLAVSDKKTVMSLESVDDQLKFLSSIADVDPNTSIQYTLRDLDRLPEFIERMKKNWRSGDLEAFLKNAFVTDMKKEFPDLYNTLVTKRNNEWMKQLPSFIKDEKKEFVLVGAMHLPGKEGLLYQLKKKGFKVSKL